MTDTQNLALRINALKDLIENLSTVIAAKPDDAHLVKALNDAQAELLVLEGEAGQATPSEPAPEPAPETTPAADVVAPAASAVAVAAATAAVVAAPVAPPVAAAAATVAAAASVVAVAAADKPADVAVPPSVTTPPPADVAVPQSVTAPPVTPMAAVGHLELVRNPSGGNQGPSWQYVYPKIGYKSRGQ